MCVCVCMYMCVYIMCMYVCVCVCVCVYIYIYIYIGLTSADKQAETSDLEVCVVCDEILNKCTSLSNHTGNVSPKED